MHTPPKKHFFVIVNYNGGSNIISCIQSIVSSRKIRPHIIIVDNASRDNSLEECKVRFPRATYIYNTHNIGFAAAANVGARYALERNAASVTFCNPDAVIDNDCAFRITQIISDGRADIVSPTIFKHQSTEKWFSGGVISYIKMRALHKDFTQNKISSPQKKFISGCIMTVSPTVFKNIGLFDERFFLYYEDADFSLRAQKHGHTIAIIENARAFHKEVSEEDKEKKTYFLVLSGLLFFRKHTSGMKRLYFLIHYYLRRIKNYFDRKRRDPLSQAVHHAFSDFESKARV